MIIQSLMPLISSTNLVMNMFVMLHVVFRKKLQYMFRIGDKYFAEYEGYQIGDR